MNAVPQKTAKNRLLVRKLPPGLTEEEFWGMVSETCNAQTTSSRYYVKGHVSTKSPIKEPEYSRAYMTFVTAAALKAFYREFRKMGARFDPLYDSRCDQRVQVEYAPLQDVSNEQETPVGDELCGTVGQSDIYQSFLQHLKDPKTQSIAPVPPDVTPKPEPPPPAAKKGKKGDNKKLDNKNKKKKDEGKREEAKKVVPPAGPAADEKPKKKRSRSKKKKDDEGATSNGPPKGPAAEFKNANQPAATHGSTTPPARPIQSGAAVPARGGAPKAPRAAGQQPAPPANDNNAPAASGSTAPKKRPPRKKKPKAEPKEPDASASAGAVTGTKEGQPAKPKQPPKRPKASPQQQSQAGTTNAPSKSKNTSNPGNSNNKPKPSTAGPLA